MTAWGLEGSLLHPGQPSPALEDWEGEPAWVRVLVLLWTLCELWLVGSCEEGIQAG